MRNLSGFRWNVFVLGITLVEGVSFSPAAQFTPVQDTHGAAESKFAWSDGSSYRVPDFNAYFPDSPDDSTALKLWWETPEKPAMNAHDAISLIRRGLRRYAGPRIPILRWLGKSYIWGKKSQHPEAIELMYHASECNYPNADLHGTRGPAVYFGLSVVRPMTESILRTLVGLCINVDDPNDLGRVAWGIGAQRDAALQFLAPHLESADSDIREKARIVKKILFRELNAFDWAQERRRKFARISYGERLPEFGEVLRSGSSSERLSTLSLIVRDGIALIMDDTYFEDFSSCAGDLDPLVRRRVARVVGERWVSSSTESNYDAIALLMTLSEDVNRDVRYNAVYFGLSTVQEKESDIIHRLLEIAFNDREPNMYQRIIWGLRGDRTRVQIVLDDYMSNGPQFSAKAAREIYSDMLGESQ